MKVLLVPKIKNKTLDASVGNKYHPIAIPMSISKLLEIIIQHRLAQFKQAFTYNLGSNLSINAT